MIIGLVGFKQVGKSTAAKYLEEKYGAKRVNMKDGLVAEMKKNFRNTLLVMGKLDPEKHSDEEIINHLFETKPPLMRALMQNYGTQVRRGDNGNYWTDKWFETVNAIKFEEHPIIVVDDVRFLNEAEAVRRFKSKIIRLTRPDITDGGTHISETEQLQIVADHTIDCEPGDHTRLYEELDKILG